MVSVVLGVVFGLCIGCHAAFQKGGADNSWMQPIASGLKIPLLFGLTLVVTLPSLYVFNALVGSRLTVDSVFRILLAMIGVALAVSASLGPIVVFFSLSTKSYPFMLLLTVISAAVGGFLGLAFLLRTLHRLVATSQPEVELEESIEDSEELPEPQQELDLTQPQPRQVRTRHVESPLRSTTTDSRATAVFQIWVVVFALVGAQMSWVLRPFVGSPELPFEWFRNMESNFFHAVWQTLNRLFGG